METTDQQGTHNDWFENASDIFWNHPRLGGLKRTAPGWATSNLSPGGPVDAPRSRSLVAAPVLSPVEHQGLLCRMALGTGARRREVGRRLGEPVFRRAKKRRN